MLSPAQIFSFPDACAINQRIKKELFAPTGPLTSKDRQTFRGDIEEVFLSYLLDESHGVMLTPMTDEEQDYTCLAQVDVFLRKPDRAAPFAERCHRAIPYPLIVILHDGESLMLSLAEKRCSRDGKEKTVLERTGHTDWLPPAALDDFRCAADFARSRKTSFRELYLHYLNLLEVQQAATLTGQFREDALAHEERHRLLVDLRHLNQHLATVRAEAQSETELARQIELNLQAQQLRRQIKDITSRL